jgi:hypothetical protein
MNVGEHIHPKRSKTAPSHGCQTVAAVEENWEVVCKSAEFGGPCRGRTYGPLIKSGRRPINRTARCCEGFPVYR